ncbi:F0F1 ATP synthase subunit delta [Falsibacillus pallidus]|uniref:ATP synthase subunit delta n=1 Tax=Falsibacillus pallidus TaxID=493781 RepID=A0A370GI31_9BACI|nr:F0F1 ATP synthase subunit delta [Falsibacillus pallidus]RDI41583.1 ATP synthase F1 subcomplex delta subunit [Falsibacillus pallidus]
MSSEAVAKRYALALFQLATEQNQLDSVEEELRVVKKILIENPGFGQILSSPKLPLVQKKEILKDTFQGASPFVMNTLMILTDRHRSAYIPAVADSFIELANEAKGIADAVVYSIRELTEDEKQAVSAAFAPKVGKTQLNIQNIIDTNLLGGVKVRIGNRIFDGSLRGKLDRLERELVG